MDKPLRIGILGAARIAPMAVLRPARTVPEVEVVAIAARDRARAERFARKHGIERVRESYDALIADPEVDAVYNPLPNGLHGRWTIAALHAGKHVLCEKPFTANAEEAEEVAAVSARSPGLVVMEAFHYRYHPLVDRLLEIIVSDLGTVRRVRTRGCIPLPMRSDIRYQLDLAGGALMDIGCYAVHQLRTLAGAEPEVASARAKCIKPGVDRWMEADVRLPDGATGHIECALWSRKLLSLGASVEGDRGELKVLNMTGPHYFHRVTVRTRDPHTGARNRRSVKVKGEATYWYQLKAFVAAVQEGAPVLTPPADSIANMRVIDAIYRAAGLAPRGADRVTDSGPPSESRFARWLREGERQEGDPIPAATVVLVREREQKLETLMLRKNSKLAFGGMWVFPGGRIDDVDRVGVPDAETAARRAAVREAREEAALDVDESSLAWISHWVPPGMAPKRFATWFFVAPAPSGAVTIDGGEIHEEAWMQARDALARRDALEIELAPPTWVTLHYLAQFDTVDDLMTDARAREPFFYETRIGKGESGVAAMWTGDAGYETSDPDRPGPRYRLWMDEGGWRLEENGR